MCHNENLFIYCIGVNHKNNFYKLSGIYLSVIVSDLLVMLFPRGSPLNELDACYVSVVKVEVKPCQ